MRRPGFSLEKNGCTRVKDQPKDSQHSGAITALPAKCPKMRRQNAPLTLVQSSTSRAAPVCARFLSQTSPLPATPHPVTRAAGTPPRAAGGERDLPRSLWLHPLMSQMAHVRSLRRPWMLM